MRQRKEQKESARNWQRFYGKYETDLTEAEKRDMLKEKEARQ